MSERGVNLCDSHSVDVLLRRIEVNEQKIIELQREIEQNQKTIQTICDADPQEFKQIIFDLTTLNKQLKLELETKELLLSQKTTYEQKDVNIVRRKLLEKYLYCHKLELENVSLSEKYELICERFKEVTESIPQDSYLAKENKRLKSENEELLDMKNQFEVAIELKDKELYRLNEISKAMGTSTQIRNSEHKFEEQLEEMKRQNEEKEQRVKELENMVRGHAVIIEEYKLKESQQIEKQKREEKEMRFVSDRSFGEVTRYLRNLKVVESCQRNYSTKSGFFLIAKERVKGIRELTVVCTNPQIQFVLLHDCANERNNQFIYGSFLQESITHLYCQKGKYHLCGYINSLKNSICMEIEI